MRMTVLFVSFILGISVFASAQFIITAKQPYEVQETYNNQHVFQRDTVKLVANGIVFPQSGGRIVISQSGLGTATPGVDYVVNRTVFDFSGFSSTSISGSRPSFVYSDTLRITYMIAQDNLPEQSETFFLSAEVFDSTDKLIYSFQIPVIIKDGNQIDKNNFRIKVSIGSNIDFQRGKLPFSFYFKASTTVFFNKMVWENHQKPVWRTDSTFRSLKNAHRDTSKKKTSQLVLHPVRTNRFGIFKRFGVYGGMTQMNYVTHSDSSLYASSYSIAQRLNSEVVSVKRTMLKGIYNEESKSFSLFLNPSFLLARKHVNVGQTSEKRFLFYAMWENEPMLRTYKFNYESDTIAVDTLPGVWVMNAAEQDRLENSSFGSGPSKLTQFEYFTGLGFGIWFANPKYEIFFKPTMGIHVMKNGIYPPSPIRSEFPLPGKEDMDWYYLFQVKFVSRNHGLSIGGELRGVVNNSTYHYFNIFFAKVLDFEDWIKTITGPGAP